MRGLDYANPISLKYNNNYNIEQDCILIGRFDTRYNNSLVINNTIILSDAYADNDTCTILPISKDDIIMIKETNNNLTNDPSYFNLFNYL